MKRMTVDTPTIAQSLVNTVPGYISGLLRSSNRSALHNDDGHKVSFAPVNFVYVPVPNVVKRSS